MFTICAFQKRQNKSVALSLFQKMYLCKFPICEVFEKRTFSNCRVTNNYNAKLIVKDWFNHFYITNEKKNCFVSNLDVNKQQKKQNLLSADRNALHSTANKITEKDWTTLNYKMYLKIFSVIKITKIVVEMKYVLQNIFKIRNY